MSGKLTVVDHPLVAESLAALRDRRTAPPEFRRAMARAGALIGTEALRGLRMRRAAVTTPLRRTPVQRVEQPIVLAAVLRAGLGMLPDLHDLIPEARVGHIGLYRNEETLNPVRYYVRLPPGLADSLVLLCDPMLATGGSSSEALRIVKTDGGRHIALLCVIASRAGVRRVHETHPDVPIYAGAVDPTLNSKGYIVPGLGDAGDRLFGT